MKSIFLLATAGLFCSLSSCSLVGSALKLPASLLQSVGRTVGVSGLTDEAPDPVEETEAIENSKMPEENPLTSE